MSVLSDHGQRKEKTETHCLVINKTRSSFTLRNCGSSAANGSAVKARYLENFQKLPKTWYYPSILWKKDFEANLPLIRVRYKIQLNQCSRCFRTKGRKSWNESRLIISTEGATHLQPVEARARHSPNGSQSLSRRNKSAVLSVGRARGFAKQLADKMDPAEMDA